MSSNQEWFAKILKELREGLGLTQEAVSKELGISRGMLSNYELGKREPDFSILCDLAQFYHVPTDYLLGLTGDPMEDHPQMRNARKLLKYYMSCPKESKDDLMKYMELLKLRDASKK